MNTIALMPIILGAHKKDKSDYLDACRRKRNIVEYDCVGGATAEDVKELREFVQKLQRDVLAWLSQQKIK